MRQERLRQWVCIGAVRRVGFVAVLGLFLAWVSICIPASYSAELPKSTQGLLKELDLKPAILSGVDEELQVPEDWIKKARTEGHVKVRSIPATSKVADRFLAPFEDRYPFIDAEYFGANRSSRTVKTLEAYKSGRYIADLVANVGTFVGEFEKSGGVEDLRSIPGLKNVPEEFKDPQGAWTGTFTLYWCLAYNTRLVRKENLPRKWEDFLTNPIWRDGNLALGNRPNLWAANLWVAKGERWTKDFLTRLFTEVHPQLRKEGMNALPQLAAAGEFYGVIPSHYQSPQRLVEEGAPVSFYCPEPAPAAVGGSAIILKGAPNIYAARIFMNWLLSKEGQLAQYATTLYTPVHKDLVRKEFLPFADQILGKQQSFTNPTMVEGFMPDLFKFWNQLWLRGGGKAR